MLKTINDAPITDPMVVLDLLTKEWGDGTLRWLHEGWSRSGRGIPTHVEIMHFDRMDVHSSSDEYLVDDSVIEVLRKAGWVQGKPEWGYTDKRKMSVSDGGKAHYFQTMETLAPKETCEPRRTLRSARWYRSVESAPWCGSAVAIPLAPEEPRVVGIE